MLYSDNVTVYIYWFYFKVMYLLYIVRSAVRFVFTLMLYVSSSSILSFYLIYSHPLISFMDYPVFPMLNSRHWVVRRLLRIAKTRVVTVGIRAEG